MASTAVAAVRAEQLVHRYPGKESPALDRVSLTVPEGSVALLTGPSGSGKSTLLNLMGGLDRPAEGKLKVCGRDLTALNENGLAEFRARTAAMVFQHHLLPPGMTAAEVAAIPLLWASGVAPREALSRAEALLAEMGLTREEMRRRVERLSGGQRQRVALARALGPRPRLILADEPTSQLDDATARQILDILFSWARGDQRTLIIASHDDPAGLPAVDFRFRINDGRIAAE